MDYVEILYGLYGDIGIIFPYALLSTSKVNAPLRNLQANLKHSRTVLGPAQLSIAPTVLLRGQSSPWPSSRVQGALLNI